MADQPGNSDGDSTPAATGWRAFVPRIKRKTLRKDVTAGVVLGTQSVPDGLANGLLAGVNPVFGLYAYLFGMLGAATATSSAFMAVQGTGAMAIIITDVDSVTGANESRALFTLATLTGLMMIGAGLLHLGAALRFVSQAVIVGFINAVGVNIVLGQLNDFTAYEAEGANRLFRAFDSIFHIWQWDPATVFIGAATIALIIGFERTRVGSLGLVIAVVITSAAVELFGMDGVAQLNDVAEIPSSLPGPVWPELRLVVSLLIPAASLTFVGLVQGAAISSSVANPDGRYPDASRDFFGQGVGNVVAGAFQGVPVGGSMSATTLNRAAGAGSRQSLFVAAGVMAIVIVAFGGVVGTIAMPALAGLLMLIGVRSIRPAQMVSVARTGVVQATTLGITFVLTMIIPLQFAVLIGVGMSVLLFVIRQSNQVSIRRWTFVDDGGVIEDDPPSTVPPHEVIALQPYGSLFFAAAPVFEAALPDVTPESVGSVVIIRLRNRTDIGASFLTVVSRYAQQLDDVGSKLMIVSTDQRLRDQLQVTGITDIIGEDNIYERHDRLGLSMRTAHADADAWVHAHR